jgi:hypothetical protein
MATITIFESLDPSWSSLEVICTARHFAYSVPDAT